MLDIPCALWDKGAMKTFFTSLGDGGTTFVDGGTRFVAREPERSTGRDIAA